MPVSVCPADNHLLPSATDPPAAAWACYARPWCGRRKNGPHQRQTRRAGRGSNVALPGTFVLVYPHFPPFFMTHDFQWLMLYFACGLFATLPHFLSHGHETSSVRASGASVRTWVGNMYQSYTVLFYCRTAVPGLTSNVFLGDTGRADDIRLSTGAAAHH